MPDAGRQRVPAPANVSAGHSGDEPEHCSETSQGPAAERHSVPSGCSASAGHATLVPVQNSAASQALTASRQRVDGGRRASFGHTPLAPVHVSTASHAPAAARHTVPAGRKVHAAVQHGEPAAPASHCSLPSRTPLPHTAAGGGGVGGAGHSGSETAPASQSTARTQYAKRLLPATTCTLYAVSAAAAAPPGSRKRSQLRSGDAEPPTPSPRHTCAISETELAAAPFTVTAALASDTPRAANDHHSGTNSCGTIKP